MNNKQLTSFQFLVEGVGAVFVVVFVSAYLFSLPGNDVLHATPIFHALLAIFGGALLVLVIAALLLSATTKTED